MVYLTSSNLYLFTPGFLFGFVDVVVVGGGGDLHLMSRSQGYRKYKLADCIEKSLLFLQDQVKVCVVI